MAKKTALRCALGALLTGCAPAPEPPIETPIDAPRGLKAQGQRLQGQRLQGQRLQGLRLSGLAVQGVDLVGTRLVGTLAGRPLSGADFVGATLTGYDAQGATTAVTISAIEPDAEDASGEILLYTLSAYDAATGATGNPCEPDAQGARKALPVRGVWDERGARKEVPTEFTFACTSGVIAKCVRWGYRPWRTVSGTSLVEHHQACTRMARADYCGDGVSHTLDGTLIDIYDDLRIQTRTPDSGLIFDGAWSADGAYCVHKQRWLKLTPLLPPSCVAQFINLEAAAPDAASWSSPIDAQDLCLARRSGARREAVRMDNRSGINVSVP